MSITGAFNLVRLPFVSSGWPEKGLVLIGVNGKVKAGPQILTRSLRGINGRADVNNMADFTTKLTFPQNFFATFCRRRILCF